VECECHDASLECESSKDDDFEREFKMSLASGILFMVWCSIVFFAIGGWAFMTIMKQDKSIYSNWEDTDDDTFQDGVG